jgi:hypothetical protein
MTTPVLPACIAFAGHDRVAAGSLAEVAAAVKARMESGEQAPVLVFDAEGRPVEFDLRGSLADVLARLDLPAAAPEPKAGPGRPKLGVVAREVTLLPRHWDWLASQPGGASVALRKLVEEARRAAEPQDRLRARQEAAYRFMAVMAGNLPGYEEVLRAFYAWDREKMEAGMAGWPVDVRGHIGLMLAAI